jgi:hypothetical protein
MSNDDATSSLEVMEARMLELESRLLSPSSSTPISRVSNTTCDNKTSTNGGGWQLIEESKWRPCPIGTVFPLASKGKGMAKMSSLDLVSVL